MAIGKGIRKPSYMSRISYHSTLLGGMALLVTSILVAGDIHTRDAIAQRLQEDTIALIAQVIPPAIHENNIVESMIEVDIGAAKPLKVYQATDRGRVVAVAYETQSAGYAGPIKVIMGVDKTGKILGVRVVAHTETPGLGDKIEEARSDWILGFSGRSYENLPKEDWAVKKDSGIFDQFTGATITPRAVVRAVTLGLDTFAAHQQAMLTLPVPELPKSETTAEDAETAAKTGDL